jgi:hypothetical protein
MNTTLEQFIERLEIPEAAAESQPNSATAQYQLALFYLRIAPEVIAISQEYGEHLKAKAILALRQCLLLDPDHLSARLKLRALT